MPKAILARWKRKIIFSLIYFSYEDKLTYHVYISHQEFENCMGLLLISDENKSYYVYVKDFNRFMFNKTRCKNKKKHVCRYCLQCFGSEKVLAEHKTNCLKIRS